MDDEALMAGWDDSIFSNLPPGRPLPGSPRRPKLPANTPLMPVDPREVVGGLMDQGAQGVGHAIDRATGQPVGEGFSQPTLGREAYQMLTSPTFGGGMSPMAGAGATLAAAPLLARASRAGRTAEEIATGARTAGADADAAAQAQRAAQASPGQAALDRMTGASQPAARSASEIASAPVAAPLDPALTTAGNANVAGYRTMAEVPDIRDMHVDDAVKAAQGNPHLIEAGGSSGGAFIGAPRTVQSFDDLQALRDRFDARLKENLGGADWYDRFRSGEAQATGDDPTKNLWSSKMHGTWSQGVNPESEAQFVVKEGTGAIAGVPTKAMYANQHDAFMRAIEAGDPDMMQLGQKTGEYASHINPDYMRINPNAPGATGVNDFRYANEWGYLPNDGTLRDGEVTLNPAQHRFLDYETALAVDRANQAKLGGRSDWTGEQIQATPWVSQKAAALMRDRPGLSADDAFAEANKTTPDFYDKHAANVTTEMQPAPAGVIPGHAPNADQMTPQQRIDYANAVKWGSGPGGRDVIGEGAIPRTGVGMLTLPSEQGTGLWRKDENSPYDSNPLEIGRPLVGFNSSTSLSGDVSKTISDAQKAKTSQPSPPYALLTGDRAIPLGQAPTGKDINAAIKGAAPFDPSEPMTLTGNLKDLGTWEGFDPSGSSTIAGVPAGNKVMTQAGHDILKADAATKAVFGGQQGVGYHWMAHDPTMGGTNGMFVPMDRPATVEEMTNLGAAGKPYGMGDVTSTHGGLLATGFDPDNPPPQLKLGTRTKLEQAIQDASPQRTGVTDPVRVDAGLQMPPWGQQGAGTATDWLLGQIGGAEQLRSFMNANQGYGRVAGQMAQRDATPEFSSMIGGQRDDMWNVRQVAAADPEYEGQGWADRLQKYRDLIKSGGTLPKSIAVGGVATSLYPTAGFPAPVPQPQGQSGTTLNSLPPDWWRQQQDQMFSGY